jgi:hypothetical protein
VLAVDVSASVTDRLDQHDVLAPGAAACDARASCVPAGVDDDYVAHHPGFTVLDGKGVTLAARGLS